MINIKKEIERVKMEDLGLKRNGEKTVYDILTTPATYEIQDILRYIKDKQLVVPDIQRDNNAWDTKKKQLFIDSLIYNYPIPPMMILKNEGKKILIDGQQRLSCIMEFVAGKIKTKKTSEGQQGKKYTDLDERTREKFQQRELFFQNIVQNSPSGDDVSVIFDIFTRINTGSSKLKPMEVRFASYYGKFSMFLRKFSIDSIKNETKIVQVLNPKGYVDFSEKILRMIFMYSFIVVEKNDDMSNINNNKNTRKVLYGPNNNKKTINLKNSLDFTMKFFADIQNSVAFFKEKISIIENNIEKFDKKVFNSWNEKSLQTEKIQMPLFDIFIIALGNKMSIKPFEDLPSKIKELTSKDFPRYKELFQVQTLSFKSINKRLEYIFG